MDSPGRKFGASNAHTLTSLSFMFTFRILTIRSCLSNASRWLKSTGNFRSLIHCSMFIFGADDPAEDDDPVDDSVGIDVEIGRVDLAISDGVIVWIIKGVRVG